MSRDGYVFVQKKKDSQSFLLKPLIIQLTSSIQYDSRSRLINEPLNHMPSCERENAFKTSVVGIAFVHQTKDLFLQVVYLRTTLVLYLSIWSLTVILRTRTSESKIVRTLRIEQLSVVSKHLHTHNFRA